VKDLPATTRKTLRAFRAYIGLLEAADAMRAKMTEQLEHFDLTMAEFRLLEVLHRCGPLYREQVAEKFSYTGRAITGVAERLQERGLVQREASYLAPSEGRASQTRRAKRRGEKRLQAVSKMSGLVHKTSG
jgi:DNA-binding MarR family transcriptional regulator